MGVNENKENIWVVDDDRSIRWVLEKALTNAEMEVRTFEEANSVLSALERSQPDAIISDVRMPGMDGLALLDKIHANHPDLPVIIITAHSDLDSAVSAYQGGAFEYLPKPFDVDEAVELTRRAVKHHKEISQEKESNVEPLQETEISGEAASMQEVFRAIGRLSRSNITVLINGESGTGKELVAEALHRHSPRADNAFIALNMAAIQRDLLESELFGHEKGAFTGADKRKIGLFEAADKGTLFIDEIGELSLQLQTKLLRALETGTIRRLGGNQYIKVDVRIIAATHREPQKMLKEKTLREDLYYRLSAFPVNLPPLRERKGDITQLAESFLTQLEDGEAQLPLSPEVIQELLSYDYPGNIRELRNIIERAIILAASSPITPDLIVFEDNNNTTTELNEPCPGVTRRSKSSRLTRADILDALEQCNGHRLEAAQLLGVSERTIYRHLRQNS